MIVIVNDPPVAYTDYCIMYQKIKGRISGCLTLNKFCQRMRGGKTVTVSDASKEIYKVNKILKPIKVTFKM